MPEQVNVNRSAGDRREIRVFISSTFRDMQEEREELVKQVFPQLRRLCESRGVTWGEVDLRWGVPDEVKAEGKALPLCLQEIEHSRPYFIGILGERYGWVPEEIPESLFETQPWLREQLHHSVTALEILHGVLRNAEIATWVIILHSYRLFQISMSKQTSPPMLGAAPRIHIFKSRQRYVARVLKFIVGDRGLVRYEFGQARAQALELRAHAVR